MHVSSVTFCIHQLNIKSLTGPSSECKIIVFYTDPKYGTLSIADVHQSFATFLMLFHYQHMHQVKTTCEKSKEDVLDNSLKIIYDQIYRYFNLTEISLPSFNECSKQCKSLGILLDEDHYDAIKIYYNEFKKLRTQHEKQTLNQELSSSLLDSKQQTRLRLRKKLKDKQQFSPTTPLSSTYNSSAPSTDSATSSDSSLQMNNGTLPIIVQPPIDITTNDHNKLNSSPDLIRSEEPPSKSQKRRDARNNAKLNQTNKILLSRSFQQWKHTITTINPMHISKQPTLYNVKQQPLTEATRLKHKASVKKMREASYATYIQSIIRGFLTRRLDLHQG